MPLKTAAPFHVFSCCEQRARRHCSRSRFRQ